MHIDPPDDLFDRAAEWADLAEFTTASGRQLQLAAVYGRRRHGKSYMLRRLVTATGGFYHQALEESRRPALRRFARDVADYLGLPAATSLDVEGWDEALVTDARQRDDVSLVGLPELYGDRQVD